MVEVGSAPTQYAKIAPGQGLEDFLDEAPIDNSLLGRLLAIFK